MGISGRGQPNTASVDALVLALGTIGLLFVGLMGVAGFTVRVAALLAAAQDSPFLWLHSVDDPDLALPVTDPHRFFASFRVELSDEDAERLGLDDSTEVAAYVTVRAAERLEDFVVNLRAPILIWAGRGYQVINQSPGCELRAPLFDDHSPSENRASHG